MIDYLYEILPFEPIIILIAICALTIILLIVVISLIIKIRKLERKYDYFMRGKDAETLEDTIFGAIEDIDALKMENKTIKENMRSVNRNSRTAYQKFGMVKYNAFKGMGGNLSFTFALLNYTNSGFIINCVHSRDGCYLYIKDVDAGKTEVVLGSEEKEALEQALGYVSADRYKK